MAREEATRILDAVIPPPEHQETLTAEPVKHGRWVSTDEMIGYRCSVCGLGSDRKANYCPNCGARKDGGENG